jgi:alkyl sulfatase BDS1-like metallo-beta-lactamase superfamily hydrolase
MNPHPSPNRRQVLLADSNLVATPLLTLAQSGCTQHRTEGLTQSPTTKPPTEFTKAANKRVLENLPFNDRTDFDDAQRGFIAELPGGVLRNAKGEVVYDVKKLQVAANAPAPDTMNPSLWRVSQLNSFAGLFKVIDRLYQVRNIDIANLTIIEGEHGLILIKTSKSH